MKPSQGLILFFAISSYSMLRQDQSYIASDESLKVPGNNPLSYCDDPTDYILEINHIDIAPNPPKVGTNLSIEASGYISHEIRKNSTVLHSVKIRVGGSAVPIINEKVDLCDQLESVDKECPVEKGNLTFKRNFTLPDEVPKATYLVRADAYNNDEEEITCVEAAVDF